MKKAIIFDLDNTIYSVYSIGETGLKKITSYQQLLAML